MDTISSAAFRKTYAKLTSPTIVTVNGHVLGIWNPSTPLTQGIAKAFDVPEEAALSVPPSYVKARGEAQVARDEIAERIARFNSRPFTPVPKRGK